ncbi:oligopeptide ABC transporter permease [Deinococcus humi]|uniref:Peptide/nickel transport system permease protein n=1 Tax=Deinococcus humi TaxID=662880 RepID=A0A7W8JTP1_9DEIO|nr:oligopeptide ABC transporter permease [Deinococcus humi]MBB5362974.1 peptide/nickel transport system permease protein [Deinococcus humi]GGO25340.1 peptide ABC transporter permease [Deinococcus humi]
MTDTLKDRAAPRRRKRREGFWPTLIARFLKHKLAVLGLVVLLLLGLLAIFAPFIAPYTFDGQDASIIGQPQPPSAAHPMGTDQLGRDAFTRVLYGARISLMVGLFSALLATFLGTLIGALSGYYRGWTDTALMRFTDVVLCIPLLPLIILLSGILRPSVTLLIVIVGSLSWMGTARLVRSQFLSLREREFVEASRALGGGDNRVMFRHILPNAIGPIIVSTTLSVGGTIMLESALSFLGLGVQPPTPTWGNLLNYASQWLTAAPWLAVFPGLMILITVLAVNFLGDGLRDAFDPRN